MNSDVTVSVIVPVLNEERDIASCLAAIAAQSFPIDALEVLVVDGGSTDDTASVATSAAGDVGLRMRVLPNPLRLQGAGLNVGLAAAAGSFIVRVDARSRIEPNHVARCVDVLRSRPDVGAVGGAQIAATRGDRLIDRAIARALNNRYATGFARYRRRAASGPTDTVWMGAFRREDLRRAGGWDDAVAKNEDFELNERLRRSGHVVWYDASINSHYLPRASARAIARQFFNYGSIKGRMWATRWRPNTRQVVLLTVPVASAVAFVSCARVIGWVPSVAAAVAGALAVDAAGNRGESETPVVRVGATGLNAAIVASWWVGVVCGYLSERQSIAQPGASVSTDVATTPRSVRGGGELSPSPR